MRTIIIVFLSTVFLIGCAFSGCNSIETNFGTIAGTVFFSDETTRVAGAWVRVYDEQGTTIVAELPVDDQARFFVALPEGNYIVTAATTQNGIYSSSGDVVSVLAHQTTRYFFAIQEAPPLS
ncbi:hypothetical protein KKB99_06340 [bacterium]|nr:hypothetical protein [bacterium]